MTSLKGRLVRDILGVGCKGIDSSIGVGKLSQRA